MSTKVKRKAPATTSAQATNTAKRPKTSKSPLTAATTPKSSAKQNVASAKASTLPDTTESSDIIALEPASESESDDDQTAALLKGFESSSSDAEESDGENVEKPDPAQAALDLSTLPDPPASLTKAKANAKPKKNLEKTSKTPQSSNGDGPTTIYLSRIPHGFYEQQMHSYFTQFGDIKNLRIARNRRTGASKHYAFIEFAEPEVARIVQQTMDNYLMFKHILKVKLVPPEKIHPDLWKGANKRFRKVPWNRIEKSRVASADREGWNRRIENEEKRRREKAEKLEKLGYVFEKPALRGVESVPVRVIEPTAEADEGEGVPKRIEEGKSESVVVTETATTTTVENGVVEEVVEKTEVMTKLPAKDSVVSKKAKKTDKRQDAIKRSSLKSQKKAAVA